MAENIIPALEFDEVLRLLAAECVTPPGAARATEVVPAFDCEGVDRENRLAAEMTRRIETHGLLPFGGVPDASPLLSRLEIEGAVIRIGSTDPQTIQPMIDALRRAGLIIQRVQFVRPSLEDLFFDAVAAKPAGANGGAR